MSNMLICIVIALVLWYERDLVGTALTPLIGVLVCLCFCVFCFLCAVIQLSLCVIAPIALFLGVESRDWHSRILKRLCSWGGKL